MDKLVEKYKGLHPGLVLERELTKRHIKKGPFAIYLNEYPQTINAITKGRRGITPGLSLKIDNYLGLEEGTMYLLQAYHDLKKALSVYGSHPDVSKFRKLLFWDTNFEKLDWNGQAKAVIKRVFERGNEDEKIEAIRFYGQEKIKSVIGETALSDKHLSILEHSKIK